MERLDRKTKFNMLFAVLFAGMILSFGLVFLMNSILTPDATGGTYFDGKAPEKNIFSSFNDACIKNEDIHALINRVEYTLFDNILDKKVVGGRNDFLFPAGKNEYGYSYLDDITGRVELSENDLDHLYRYIEMRKKAYGNFGCEYVLAVIPNSQTVYKENLPEHLTFGGGKTVLTQLGEYLDAQGFKGFVNLSAALRAGKTSGLVYNNTENSINALGAYYAYREIVNSLEMVNIGEDRVLSADHFAYYTRYTDGKSLAQRAGLSDYIRNRTVSIATSVKYIYTTAEFKGDLETTYTKYEYIDKIPQDPAVLIELTNEWDKIQLMPYFSSTFGRVSYRVSKGYDHEALKSANPKIVIQVIREDELFSVLEYGIYSSYSEGLTYGQHPYETMKPSDVEYVFLDKNTLCVTGMAGSGAEINIFGDGVERTSTVALSGRFFATVKLEAPDRVTQICINSKVKDKSVSDTVYLLIDSNGQAVKPDGVSVGGSSMLYKDKYESLSIPTVEEADRFRAELSETIGALKATSGNKNTKVIFGVIPEKMSVYSEGAPKIYSDRIATMKRVRMLFSGQFKGVGAAECIDFTSVLTGNSGSGKLYYQTTESITDLGSYHMYYALMSKIGSVFPAVVPREQKDIVLKNTTFEGGDLSAALGFEAGKITENVAKIDVDISKYINKSEGFDISEKFVSYNYVAGLPTAVVVRGEGCDKMLELMMEHFSVMYVLAEGDSDIPEKVLKTVAPDYIIYLCPEGNIDFSVK